MVVDIYAGSAKASRIVQWRLPICTTIVTQFVTHFVRVSVSAGVSDPEAACWVQGFDRFRVRAEPLPRNAGEWGPWSVRRIAHVCRCAGWLADSLADGEQAAALGRVRAPRDVEQFRRRSRRP